jgi:hypothetical protein
MEQLVPARFSLSGGHLRRHLVRQAVNSTMIVGVGYDSSRRILEIEFRRGARVYRYFDVPEFLYQGLLVSTSKGRFFTTRSAGRYRTECIRG